MNFVKKKRKIKPLFINNFFFASYYINMIKITLQEIHYNCSDFSKYIIIVMIKLPLQII